MQRRTFPALLAGVLLLGATVSGAAERSITVFAAASMTDVLQEVGHAWTTRSGIPVRFSFAGSSTLARQIEAGAPADAFVSADEEWMDYLAQRKLIALPSRRDVAGNSLVLVAPADRAKPLRLEAASLQEALGRRGRIATGDPDTVPAGRYARAALRALGLWDDMKGRLVPADSVRSALNFVARGEAALGIVYATDARGVKEVREVATFPASSHTAITYPAAAMPRADAAALDFLDFLRGEQARALFHRYGFTTP